MMEASKLATKFYLDYNTTYGCRVNLEGTIQNMLLDGIPINKIEEYLTDILDNVEFVYERTDIT